MGSPTVKELHSTIVIKGVCCPTDYDGILERPYIYVSWSLLPLSIRLLGMFYAHVFSPPLHSANSRPERSPICM